MQLKGNGTLCNLCIVDNSVVNLTIDYFSYNARWNSRCVVKNPNFWELCKKIWEAFEDTSNDIGRLNRDPPGRITREVKIKNVINMQNLRKAERELENGGSVMCFLRKARHTFGNANKKYFTKLIEAIENDAELGGDIQEEEEQDEAPVQVHTCMLKTMKTLCQSYQRK